MGRADARRQQTQRRERGARAGGCRVGERVAARLGVAVAAAVPLPAGGLSSFPCLLSAWPNFFLTMTSCTAQDMPPACTLGHIAI